MRIKKKKSRLKSQITQKMSRQVSGESTMNKHTDTSGKMCVYSPNVQCNCHSSTLLHIA